jgi:hypothetical protein
LETWKIKSRLAGSSWIIKNVHETLTLQMSLQPSTFFCNFDFWNSIKKTFNHHELGTLFQKELREILLANFTELLVHFVESTR